MQKVTKIKKWNEKILETILSCIIYNEDKGAFTRNRKMTLRDFVIMLLGNCGRTTSVELLDFYKKAEKHSVCKQDYSKQRMKISEKFWIEANKGIVTEFYNEMEYDTLKKYIIVAIDGSKIILPRCKELEEKYGIANANHTQQKCVQCLVSGCYDVLNGVMLNIEIAPYASNEREYAKKNIENLLKMFPDKKFLFLFDRGYPSLDMLTMLEELGVKYLFRLQKSTYEEEKRNMKSNDEIVNIKINKDRLSGKMSNETKNKLKEMGSFKTRFVKCELENGKIEWLITNLDKKNFPSEVIMDLYSDRWNIETAYNTLKLKLQIENISGKKDITVRQDIFATIIVYNIIAGIEFILKDENINNESNKYNYQINENVLIGAFKDMFIEMVITQSPKKQKQLYDLFYQYVIRCKTAIIPKRSYPRDFNNGNLKCKVNYKRAF